MKLSNQSRGYLERWLTDNGRNDTDINAYWSDRFDFEENKKNIARLMGIPYQSSEKKGFKQGTQEHYTNNAKQAKQENERQRCAELGESCEVDCNNAACKTFKKYGCAGEVEPCDVISRRHHTAYTRKKTGSSGDCAVRLYCVAPHTRPPQHNSRTGNPIQVKGYCVQQHPRLCRRGGKL